MEDAMPVLRPNDLDDILSPYIQKAGSFRLNWKEFIPFYGLYYTFKRAKSLGEEIMPFREEIIRTEGGYPRTKPIIRQKLSAVERRMEIHSAIISICHTAITCATVYGIVELAYSLADKVR